MMMMMLLRFHISAAAGGKIIIEDFPDYLSTNIHRDTRLSFPAKALACQIQGDVTAYPHDHHPHCEDILELEH